MPARLWSLPDLPEGTPLPQRLEALEGAVYLAAGSIVTPELKQSLVRLGVSGFRETDGSSEPTPAGQSYFLQDQAQQLRVLRDVKQAGAAPLPGEIDRMLALAAPMALPPTPLLQKLEQLLGALYRRPQDRLDLLALPTLLDQIIDWAATLHGTPVLCPRLLDPLGYLPAQAVDSALWAAWFAARVGLPRTEIKSLLLAALLRDIGLLACSEDVLYGGQPVTALDRAPIHDHPLRSIQWLFTNQIDDDEVHRTVRQHHERVDGTGYPLQLPGALLSKSSQVLALTDTLVAVSSPRPHRPARPLQSGVQAIVQGAGTRFDPGLTRMLMQTLGAYPPGSVLLLDRKMPAVVIDSTGTHRYRPLVQCITRDEGQMAL
ncbi:MAG: HD domain-containing phosphohydrolase, partial [bacterium]